MEEKRTKRAERRRAARDSVEKKPPELKSPEFKTEKPTQRTENKENKLIKVEAAPASGLAALAAKTDPTDIAAVAKLYDPITALVGSIRANTETLLAIDAKSQGGKQDDVATRVDDLVNKTTALCIQCKDCLETLKRLNWAWKASKPLGNDARNGLYSRAALEYQAALTEFKTVSTDLKRKLIDNKKSPLRTIAQSMQQPLSEDQLDTIVQRGQGEYVMQQLMMEDNAQLEDIIADIESRHKRILTLEHDVTVLLELFKDLATLVDMQQEPLTQIAKNLESAKRHVEEGEKELGQANKHQKSARRNQWRLLACGLGALVPMAIGGGVTGAVLSKA